MNMKNFNDLVLLVPNTGFKMFFFPLSPDPLEVSDREAKRTLQANLDACAGLTGGQTLPIGGNDCPWYQQITNPTRSPWREPGSVRIDSKEYSASEMKPRFIRYRFGEFHSGNERYAGLWFAIETNIGTNDRSWLWENPPVSQEDRRHFEAKGEPATVYFDRDHNIPDADMSVSMEIEGRLVALRLRWSQMLKDTPVDVDLVVDFGNSRTSVLVLEHVRGKPGNFSQNCRPLALKPAFYSVLPRQTRVEDAIVSSRFVLKTPEFRRFDPDSNGESVNPESLFCIRYESERAEPGFIGRILGRVPPERLSRIERRIPHMFVKLSPVCLGDDMEELIHGRSPIGQEANRRMQLGEQLQQSSAKRYFWDQKPSPQAWSCVPGYGDPVFNEPGKLSLLSGQMLRFQPEDGASWGEAGTLPSDWRPELRPSTRPNSPRYPRRNTLTWSILSIMETAQRQINDLNWTQHSGAFHRRTIRNVIATYPSGWTSTEIAAYRSKWTEAISIFHATNYESTEPPISLSMKMDEAVASQLPLIYASMARLSGQAVGENWVRINGSPKGSAHPTLRVMNLDIGGGTSDVSIVDYKDHKEGVAVELEAKVLFKDSSTVAGDRLVKALIEKLILPKLADSRERFANFAQFLAVPKNAAETSERVTLLTGSLLPMAVHLLSSRCSGKWNDGELRFTPAEAKATNFEQLTERLGMGKVDPRKRMLAVDVEEFDALVESVFGKFISSIAKYASCYQVDLLMVCGKPSEQPRISDLIKRLIPIATERMLFTKGFKAGSWYPIKEGEDSAIADAKTVTCVGAALARAMELQVVPGWKIEIKNESSSRNIWGEMPKSGPVFGMRIMTESQNEATADLMVGASIGRKLFDARSCFPEPVYRLEWRGDKTEHRQVRCLFRRNVAAINGADADSLELVEASDSKTGEDLTGQVELRLRPVGDDDVNWQDSDMLEVFSSTLNKT